MTRGSSVDGASASTSVLRGHMRHNLAQMTCFDEVMRVAGLVGTSRLRPPVRHRIEHGQRSGTLTATVSMGDHCADHQAGAILHQHMPLIAEDRRSVVALAVPPGIRIRRAGVRVVGPRLPLPIRLRVAARSRRRLIVTAVLGFETLLACPGLNQRAIDTEVVPREQPAAIGLTHDFGEEGFYDRMFQKPVAILREHRVVPHRIVNGHSDVAIPTNQRNNKLYCNCSTSCLSLRIEKHT